jgi:hypothetical protein
MSPDEAALIRLWEEKRRESEPEDFSGNLVVQLGVATEALNQSWYERNTGRVVTDVQRWVRHPVHRYGAAPAQHVGEQRPLGGPLDHHWRRQMDRDETIPADALYQHFVLTAERRFWRLRPDRRYPAPYGIEPPRPRIEGFASST